MRILGISGSKGGVGVTTVAAQLGTTLAIQGHDTLVVELNRSGGGTDILGMSPSARDKTVSRQLVRGVFDETRVLDGIPEFRLVDARPDVDLFSEIPARGALRQALRAMEREPAIVVVDMESGLGPLARWTMGECDDVIVVVQPAGLSVRPVPSMVDVIGECGSVFSGLLENRYGVIGETGRQCVEELSELFGEWMLPMHVPQSDAVQKAAMNGNSIFWEDGRSDVARAFKELGDLVTSSLESPIAAASA